MAMSASPFICCSLCICHAHWGPCRLLARKVMMGLNFFGNDFVGASGGGPIIAAQYLEALRKHRHVLEYVAQGERHTIYYPTLMSVQRRLELAYEYGVGVSIWDLGQGLDFFMDLL